MGWKGGLGMLVVASSVVADVAADAVERSVVVQGVAVQAGLSPAAVAAVAAAVASVVDVVPRTSRAAGAFACCFEGEGRQRQVVLAGFGTA